MHFADLLKSQVDLGLSCLGPYQSPLSELAKFDLNAAQGAQVHSRGERGGWCRKVRRRLPIPFDWRRSDWLIGITLCLQRVMAL